MKKVSEKLEKVLKYCNDIKKGKILSGRYTKKAIERFLEDLEQTKNEKSLFVFDEEKFLEVVNFAESLKLPDTKQNLKLLPFQLFIYANLFGFVYRDNTNRRRFRTGYIEIARKNGKTSGFLFPLLLYDFLSTTSAEAYLVSQDDKQAEKTYKEIIETIEANNELNSLKENNIINCLTHAITFKTSRIAFFSSEAKAIDSYRNSLSVMDEYWNYKTDKIITAFRYGGRARENNLNLIITSAGLDIGSPCFAENNKAKTILDKQINDESYFCIIYAYDEKDDWKDPKNFIKANPALNEIINEDVLMSDLQDALITPSHQQDFKSKTCGIWTNTASSWIPTEKIINDKKIDLSFLEKEKIACYGGLDLSAVNDLTAFSLCFRKEDLFYFLHKFWIPEETLKERISSKENINFQKWVNDGIITTISGSVIDEDFVIEDCLKLAEKYNIKEVCFDRWKSKEIIKKLSDKLSHIDFIEFDQSLRNMSEPTKDYEKLFLNEKIIELNPCQQWQISNVKIKPDANGNYKPIKDYAFSSKRIDGVITSIMALNRAKVQRVEQKTINFEDVLNMF